MHSPPVFWGGVFWSSCIRMGAKNRIVDDIDAAVEVLRAGGLVAFPTETVYGLGADARNPAAVARVFRVKGRPLNHPVIVHLAAASQMDGWARAVPETARLLAERFWPGPLTLVLARHESVGLYVTGGQETVAVRVPAHPVALELLRKFGGGVAAPSANRFGKVSPTTAAHVQADLGDAADLILDGGPCAVGIESTIVDLSGARPVLLRPGGVCREDLEKVLGQPVEPASASGVRAPGTLVSHYAPRAEVVLCGPGEIGRRVKAALRSRRVAAWGGEVDAPGVVRFPQPESAAAWARDLYATLREADRLGIDILFVTLPGEKGLGLAVADRLRKAAARDPSS